MWHNPVTSAQLVTSSTSSHSCINVFYNLVTHSIHTHTHSLSLPSAPSLSVLFSLSNYDPHQSWHQFFLQEWDEGQSVCSLFGRQVEIGIVFLKDRIISQYTSGDSSPFTNITTGFTDHNFLNQSYCRQIFKIVFKALLEQYHEPPWPNYTIITFYVLQKPIQKTEKLPLCGGLYGTPDSLGVLGQVFSI